VSAPLSAPPSTTASPAAPVAAPAPKPASGLDLPPLPTPSAPAKPAPVAKTAAAPRSDTYTVKEGDSIASIWRTVSGSERGWEKLLAANPGVDPSRLKIGQVLKVPDHAASAASETRVASAPAPSRAGGSPGSYTVQSGDTLSRIAGKTLGDSKRWKEIYEANRDSLGNDPGALEVGQVLRIPGKAAATKPTATKPAVDKPAVDKPAVDKPAVDKPVDNPGSTGGVTTPAPAVSPSPAPSPAPR
jgi:nucleoid-associated protein YgaU